MNGCPVWQAVSVQRFHVINTVRSRHFEISREKDKVDCCGTWASAWKEIHSGTTWGRQTHPGVTHGLGKAFLRKYFWVGFPNTWLVWDNLDVLSFLKVQLFSSPSPVHLLSLIAPSVPLALLPCLACRALLFYFISHSQVACDTVPSHTEGDFNYGRTQKQCRLRAVQIKERNREINYKDETFSFHFILTAW